MWAWIIDILPLAAASDDFGAHSTAKTLASLCKLGVFALRPSLLRALRGPLLRALDNTGMPGGLDGRGLSQVLWAFGRCGEASGLLAEVKDCLWAALEAAAPTIDAQGIATAWWALGEASARCPSPPPRHLCLSGNAAPGLLACMAAAAASRAEEGGMSLQGISQVGGQGAVECQKCGPSVWSVECGHSTQLPSPPHNPLRGVLLLACRS